MTDPNYRVKIPGPIKAMITRFEVAHQEFVFIGAKMPEDHASIEENYEVARYNLERTIKTYLDRPKEKD